MLGLSVDTLKELGVNKILQPMLHFVLNQQADPNIENHKTGIENMIADIKGNDIDISLDKFHALPNAYRVEHILNDTKLPSVKLTQPKFIEETQKLCKVIINSATLGFKRSSEGMLSSSLSTATSSSAETSRTTPYTDPPN
ncbi:unnamed protein product [Didymodactylos carnosus]|uniref:Uncharacterized protein n=1 Tax=Didymodactylos carnosus TaxID=1234261 RepID=A0A814TSK5_9BILA|nr:unnamed protein product [Didymodactylos carnosus]CAF1162032.1 unnamed protein product [Didymodactylos carnosus]CAF3739086.1 unnamed protein product [Didymodactylos carnosus]CAF3925638.1 unnamed protein product [Didymodactylos carnosus]